MSKYLVRWKPRKGGRVQFVTDPIEAESPEAAVARVARSNHIGELVSVTEHVVDLWTPMVKSGLAAALVNHLEDKAVREGWRSLGD